MRINFVFQLIHSWDGVVSLVLCEHYYELFLLHALSQVEEYRFKKKIQFYESKYKLEKAFG